jgi:hypothetical protein
MTNYGRDDDVWNRLTECGLTFLIERAAFAERLRTPN